MRNIIPWHGSLMLYQITAATSRWVLPHIHRAWWNSDNDKNKQMNNILNVNAVEIVQKNRAVLICVPCIPFSLFYHLLIFLWNSKPSDMRGPWRVQAVVQHGSPTMPTVWLPTFVGLHNGTKLQRGYNFSVNQFSQLKQWEFFLFHNGFWWFVTTTRWPIPIWNPFSVSIAPLNQ